MSICLVGLGIPICMFLTSIATPTKSLILLPYRRRDKEGSYFIYFQTTKKVSHFLQFFCLLELRGCSDFVEFILLFYCFVYSWLVFRTLGMQAEDTDSVLNFQ